MVTIIELIRKLRSPENKRVLQAVEELRVRGWLEDGSLDGVLLCHVHMEGADLINANLSNVDLHQAHLEFADLSMADLKKAKLSRTNLQGANLSGADLREADLFKANLKDALNLTDDQLSQAKRLYGAVMPDGTTYDGRFNLEGDISFAKWGKVDIDDPKAMAYFYGVSLKTYLDGQELKVEATVKSE
jgi:hypothetical protein